ncbi:MAG TPA: Uma2 family endonuclease [Chloroflexota bacterium]|jgi:Uma2 family endonuclease
MELLPLDDPKRYEIIHGELYVSKAPSTQHQIVCSRVHVPLDLWDRATGLGVVIPGPGLIFAEDEDVIPDLVWVSKERLALILAPDGKLHAAPELIVEVLSPGAANERRDREAKLDLYSHQGVREYWIPDWEHRLVYVYRRVGLALEFVATLLDADTLDSPLLPGFALPVHELFAELPVA